MSHKLYTDDLGDLVEIKERREQQRRRREIEKQRDLERKQAREQKEQALRETCE